MSAFINHVDFQLGSTVSLSELPPLQGKDTYKELMKEGFDTISIFDEPPQAALLRAVDRFFAASPLPRGVFDTILFASETIFATIGRETGSSIELKHEFSAKKVVETLVLDAGLLRAVPIGLSMGGCSNISSALRLASALIESGRSKNTLIIVLEQAQRAASRLMDNDAAPLSDIAFCVSVAAKGSLRIRNCYSIMMSRVVQMKAVQEPLRQGLELARAMRSLSESTNSREGKSIDEFEVIATDNFRQSFYDVILSAVPVSASDLCQTTKGEVGHAFGCECVLNAMPSVESKKETLLLNVGRTVLGALTLEPA